MYMVQSAECYAVAGETCVVRSCWVSGGLKLDASEGRDPEE
jgi:hypothetical protein